MIAARIFLSTPSARRATIVKAKMTLTMEISIHALREEGDGMPLGVEPSQQISIHALREEGDPEPCKVVIYALIFLSTPSARRATPAAVKSNDNVRFLSTPSARRATGAVVQGGGVVGISIHALREEGDTACPSRESL